MQPPQTILPILRSGTRAPGALAVSFPHFPSPHGRAPPGRLLTSGAGLPRVPGGLDAWRRCHLARMRSFRPAPDRSFGLRGGGGSGGSNLRCFRGAPGLRCGVSLRGGQAAPALFGRPSLHDRGVASWPLPHGSTSVPLISPAVQPVEVGSLGRASLEVIVATWVNLPLSEGAKGARDSEKALQGTSRSQCLSSREWPYFSL